MGVIRSHGIEMAVPAGCEARIFRRPPVAGAATYPVVHLATFPLPGDVGDFGNGAVQVMGGNDVFVVLFEYGPESVGQALFARQGMPRALAPSDFQPYRLRQGVGGRSGTQWFFVEAGRPFSLYAVLGSHARRATLVPRLNGLLAGIAVQPAPPATLGGGWN
ncbi:MAG TPA: hypothetical protein VKV36_10490 [Acidimicrobiales bacterium]|nr:hypothetical protein [Acidimicrobiales bacterium]